MKKGINKNFLRVFSTLMVYVLVVISMGPSISKMSIAHAGNNNKSVYDKNQEIVNMLPTDEEGLKPYLKVNIDKHRDPSDPKHCKNISMEDYLKIKRTVISILNKFFGTNIPEDEITNATTDEKTNQLLEKFKGYTKKHKAKAIYDWITENIACDDDQGRPPHGVPTNSVVTVFNNLFGICQGFSNVSKVMMRIAGVPCFYALSNNHAFNYICIEDEDLGNLVWRPMDTTAGSYKKINHERKPVAVTKRSDDFFPSTKNLSEKICNDFMWDRSLKIFTVKSNDDLGHTVNFHVWNHNKEKVVRVSLRDNLKNGSSKISIPKILNTLEGYILFLPKGLNIKTLDLGESNFSQIVGLGDAQAVTFPSSSKVYENEGNTVINKTFETVVFNPNIQINPYIKIRGGFQLIIKNYKGTEDFFVNNETKFIRINLSSNSDLFNYLDPINKIFSNPYYSSINYTIPPELQFFSGYAVEIFGQSCFSLDTIKKLNLGNSSFEKIKFYGQDIIEIISSNPNIVYEETEKKVAYICYERNHEVETILSNEY